jgi:hypothetical protein
MADFTSETVAEIISESVAELARNQQRSALAVSPLVRQQAYGESLDPERAGKLQTYDLRLDRQFERTLATLLQLQAARRTIGGNRVPAAIPERIAS